MENSDESEQEASLELYKAQLSQVDQAIQAAGHSEDLMKLKSDLEELIKLTEDNLLEIKRARLLQILGSADDDNEEEEEEESVASNPTTKATEDIDDEYAAFQAAVGGSCNMSHENTNDRTQNDKNEDSESSGIEKHTSESMRHKDENEKYNAYDDSVALVNESLLELVGTKCRAPFSQEWGDLHYGNALILSVDPPEHAGHLEECKVHVIFTNPVHQSMVPCKYFMEGKCRFSAEDCRSSHGHPVTVTQLHPYLEPDHSKLKEGCRCLAKPELEDIWYQGLVEEVHNDYELTVRYDSTKEEDTVLVEHVIPLDNDESDGDTDCEDDTDSDDDSDFSNGPKSNAGAVSDDEGEDEVPVYLWKPLQTTEKLGAWETHTKGIGSKLMAKMGYIPGQGLGRYGEGRAEPVPILLLPPGKSLDKIMQLKELAGDDDLFNANKRLEKRQRMLEKKEAEMQKRKKNQPNLDVFGFLNKHLGKTRGEHRSNPQGASSSAAHPSTSSSSTSSPSSSSLKHAKQSSEKDLSTRSDKEVNLQIFKTAEAIRSVERNLAHLKRQLARNEDKDRKMAEKVRQKIAEEENNLRKLKNSSNTLESHKDRRKAHKKLTVF